MRPEWGRPLQISATFIGAVVGAGFASGQELIQFFAVFGHRGLWGVLLSGLLFAIMGTAVLFLAERWEVESYQELLRRLFGYRLGAAFDVWIMLFLFAGLCIMLAGSGSVFQEHLGLPSALGVGLTSLCVCACLFRQGKGVIWVNSLLIPILVVVTLTAGIGALFLTEPSLFPDFSPGAVIMETAVPGNWAVAAILYVSYNMVVGMVILTSLGAEQIRGSVAGGAIGGLCLGLMAFVITSAMLKFFHTAGYYEIPMLFVAGRVCYPLKYVYALVLWIAMLTTAIADAFGLVKRIGSGTRTQSPWLGALLVLAALPFTKIGFASLVGRVYPVFGYAGLTILGMVALWTLHEAVMATNAPRR